MLLLLAPAMTLYAVAGTMGLRRVCGSDQRGLCEIGSVAYVLGAVFIAKVLYRRFSPKARK
jgi:hypothetical protein